MSATWKFTGDLLVKEGTAQTVETVSISETVNMNQKLTFVLADQEVDKEIDFALVIGSGKAEELLIVSDKEITMKKDASTADGIVGKVFMFSRSDFSKVFLSNDSGDDARVEIVVGG